MLIVSSDRQASILTSIRLCENSVKRCCAEMEATNDKVESLVSLIDKMIHEQSESLKMLGLIVTSVKAGMHGDTDDVDSDYDPVNKAVMMIRRNRTYDDIVAETGLDEQTVDTLLRIHRLQAE